MKKLLSYILILGIILNLTFASLSLVLPNKTTAQQVGAHFRTGNFFLVGNVTQATGWGDPISANPGEVLNYKAEIVNDGTQDAQNVEVKVDLPQGQDTSLVTTFRVRAANAAEATDTATVNVNPAQTMEYLPEHTYVTRPDGSSEHITSPITTQWVNIGIIKPGQAMFVEVLFKTRLSNVVNYSMFIEKLVANNTAGTGWQKSVNANPGDIVQFKLQIRNTSPARVNDVLVKDVLPVGLTFKTDEPILVVYKPGTDVVQVTDFGVLATGGAGLNAGPLDPYVNPFWSYIEVKFKATVDANASGTMTNTGRVRSVETNWIEDTASVVVQVIPSVTPTPTPTPTPTGTVTPTVTQTPTPTPTGTLTPTLTPTVTQTPTPTLTPTPTPTNVPGNLPPVCDDLSVNPASGGTGLNVTLRGRGHDQDSNGFINWIRFDYGDGTDTTVNQNFGNSVDYTLTHRYNNVGSYTARFFLRDDDGSTVGGDGVCAKQINVYGMVAGVTVVEQPRTGGEVLMSLLFAVTGMVGLVLKRKI